MSGEPRCKAPRGAEGSERERRKAESRHKTCATQLAGGVPAQATDS